MVICSRLVGIITPVIVIDSFDFSWGIWEGFVCYYDLDLFVLIHCLLDKFRSVTGSVHIRCLLDKSLYPETSKQTKL